MIPRSLIRQFSMVTRMNKLTWNDIGLPPGFVPLESNLTPKVWALTKKKLFRIENHPVAIMKSRIQRFFDSQVASCATVPLREKFTMRDDFDCVVSVKNCFDDLLIPLDHVSRRRSDTYYVNNSTVLRTHTSAHQIEMISSGARAFTVFGMRTSA